MMDDLQASEAIQHYEALLARDPGSRAFAQLADAYHRQGRYAEAIAVCDSGLQRYPAFVGARMTLARALADSGDVARAEAEFRRVLEQTPDNIPAHRALGDLLRRQGRPPEALAVYEALHDFIPFDQEITELVEALGVTPSPPGPLPTAPLAAEPEVTVFDLTEVAGAPPLPLGPPVGIPEAEGAGPPPALATETLADLYVQQGFVEEARAIYRELVLVHPSREDLRAKLASLEAAPPPVPGGEGAPAPAEVVVSAPAAARPGGDDLAEILRAWAAAARDLRAERQRR
ncbi:MAG TPA: tetratricopeptide repeat protein, partial [Candidatus Methylomirabilis sp.]|jgi:tetratricopeptide (TPR) repeat protein